MLLVFSGTRYSRSALQPKLEFLPLENATCHRGCTQLFQGGRLMTMLRKYAVACHNLHALVLERCAMCGKAKCEEYEMKKVRGISKSEYRTSKRRRWIKGQDDAVCSLHGSDLTVQPKQGGVKQLLSYATSLPVSLANWTVCPMSVQELQEQEKAELRARIDAAYSSDGPDHPKTVRSRGQRHADEREERKLARAQDYLDEKEMAALKESAQARGEGRRVSAVDMDRGTAPIGQSSKGEVGNIGGADEKGKKGQGEKVDPGEKSAGVESEQKQSPREGEPALGIGDASEGEVQRLKVKVAELERGLRGLEESLRGEAHVSNGQKASGPSMVPLKDWKGALTPPGLGVPGVETRAKSADEEGKDPRLSQSCSKGVEERSNTVEESTDSEAVSRRHSLFDYIWPHWLRTSSEGRRVEGSERTTPSKGNPQKPP
jgi:hypothetical protein